MKMIFRAPILFWLTLGVILPLSLSAQDADDHVEILAENSVADTEANKITFSGDVVVKMKAQHISMECDKLEVFLAENGSKVVNTQGQQSRFAKAIATGKRVEVQIKSPGKNVISATAERIEYDAKTNDTILSGGKPTLKVGENIAQTISDASKIVLHGNGKYEIPGRVQFIIPISSGKKILSTGK